MSPTVQRARRRLQTFPPLDRVSAARRAIGGCTVDEAIAELDAEHQALEARRILREPKALGGVRRQPQCGSCRKFIANPARPCGSCGYLEDRGWA